MLMRLVMVIVLMTALTGCLKKNPDENISTDTQAAQETVNANVTDAGQGTDAAQVKNVSVEPDLNQAAAVDKPSVQDVQQALKNANLYDGAVDGISGPKTRKAVEAFQSKKGLKADGKVGPRTWLKLKEYLNKKTD
jgi:peptidoglycan hydrolase-like protein with peptidoglycan-binding domain